MREEEEKREKQEKMEEAKRQFEEKFGAKFPENTALVGGKAIYACTPEAAAVEQAEVRGVKFTDLDKNLFKPSTDFVQLFGGKVERNCIDVSREDAERFARLEKLKTNRQNGVAIVKWEGFALGCGLVKNGVLKPVVSKSRCLARGKQLTV